MIRGVNSNEWHPKKGRTLDRAFLEEDLKLMKRFNFNAVRCSHYPRDKRFYELCSELGLWVMDEANLESHEMWEVRNDPLTTKPEWKAAMVARADAVINADYNYPCVISWSLGNEVGIGDNIYAMEQVVRETEAKFNKLPRPVHYESRDYSKDPIAFFDIISNMYEDIDKMVGFTKEGRPLVYCEYAHAMGNSSGNYWKFWDAFRAYPNFQGGFIWDWADQGIERPVAGQEGKTYFAYGGDFGETPHDANFVINGLVDPDRDPHPGAYEVKNVQAPLVISMVK